MKLISTLTVVWAMTIAAFGQQTFSTNVTVNAAIPDNNANGLASVVTVGGVSGPIGSVTLSVDITGGFNGDLYAYLAKPGSGFAVLLNRTGVSNTASAFGFGNPGFNVTFDDSAANGSIHYYQNVINPGGTQLTGTWQPDGANIDPQSAPANFLTAGQTAMLSSFTGASPNGQWVFFVADLSGGGQSMLANYTLTISTVPEPANWALMLFAGLALWLLICRSRRSLRQ